MIIFILRITLFICKGEWVPPKTASSGITCWECACPLLLFLPARVILSSLLSPHVYAHVDALQRSQQMRSNGLTPQKRKLCAVAANGRELDLRAVTSDIPANDFQIPQHQAIDRRVQPHSWC
ncbi:hypothetical protein T05_4635 [Trichinella murrelli]|uniref:Uncharacterized protein n=1 Tax=Trichinella murrelli TaxID=144512 RepID=A0A0V0T715_9BILA|nr:hypothetical protein T05_4635 [Trichinella murrelli]